MDGDSETAAAELASHFEKTARSIIDAYPDRGQSDPLSARSE
jgi:hypothetical protein